MALSKLPQAPVELAGSSGQVSEIPHKFNGLVVVFRPLGLDEGLRVLPQLFLLPGQTIQVPCPGGSPLTLDAGVLLGLAPSLFAPPPLGP
jgi:hypothetical protein